MISTHHAVAHAQWRGNMVVEVFWTPSLDWVYLRRIRRIVQPDMKIQEETSIF